MWDAPTQPDFLAAFQYDHRNNSNQLDKILADLNIIDQAEKKQVDKISA
jgi:hypothetical protein